MTVLSWDTASSSNDTDQATPMASPCSTHEPIHSASTTDIHGSTPRRSRSLLQPFYYNDEQRAASVNVPSFLFRRDAQPDATFRRHHSARRHDNKSEARAQERGPRTRHHLSRAILPGLRKLLPPSWSASKKTNASERRRPPPPLAPPPLPSSTRTNGAAGPAVARRIVHLAIKPPLDKGKSGEKRLCSNKVENFHQALDNALVDSHIRDFCKRTLSVENVAFVRQVRTFALLVIQAESPLPKSCRSICMALDFWGGTGNDKKIWNGNISIGIRFLVAKKSPGVECEMRMLSCSPESEPWVLALATSSTVVQPISECPRRCVQGCYTCR